MNTKLQLSLLSASLLTAVSSMIPAQTALANEYIKSYPTLIQSQCPFDLNRSPKVKAGNYVSADCKTVFVLPQQEGTIEYQRGGYDYTPQECSDLRGLEGDLRRARRKTSQLQEQQDMHVVGSPSWQNLQSQIDRQISQEERFENRIYKATHRANGVALQGAWLKFVIEDTQESEYVNAFKGLNAQAVSQHNLKVTRAPIYESYLTISAAKNLQASVASRAVLAIETDGIEDQISPNTFLYNGSMTATVRMSPSAACHMMKDYPNLQVLRPGVIEGYMSATKTYTVPVQTQMGYTATLKTHEVLDLINTLTQRRSKFRAENVLEQAGSANMSTAIKVEIFRGPTADGNSGQDEDFPFDLEFIQTIKAELIDTFMSKLVRNKLLELDTTSVDAPSAGTEVVLSGYRRSCKWFGFKCKTQPVYTTVNRDGFGQAIELYKRDLQLEVTDELSVYDIITDVHTGAMKSPQ